MGQLERRTVGEILAQIGAARGENRSRPVAPRSRSIAQIVNDETGCGQTYRRDLMRILIVTAGSRGDVAPFTGLGQRLQQAGHQVALAAHGRFAELVRECGLEYRALPGDPVELVRARTAAPSPEAARSVFAAFLDELGDGVLAAAAAGADVLLTAFGPAPLGRLVAEGLGIPSVGVYLAPGVPTREFPPPGWPNAGQLSPADNLAAGREVLSRTGSLYADVLWRLRARLDLPAATAEPPADWPVCHGFSPAVVPRPADWPATRARHRILVAGPAAGMAAPGSARRLPRGRSPSGVRRVRQHDPDRRATP